MIFHIPSSSSIVIDTSSQNVPLGFKSYSTITSKDSSFCSRTLSSLVLMVTEVVVVPGLNVTDVGEA